MKILVGCEESQVVTNAFREKGFKAFSCDILPCSGAYPEWHIKDNIENVVTAYKWDCLIVFPPCTYLTVTANRSFLNNPPRWDRRLEAIKFVHYLLNLPIPHIALENPKGVISSHIRKPDQYIQPYQFGHYDSKMTGLWLKNLPLLQPTKTVEPKWIVSESGKRHSKTHWENPSTNNKENARIRAKTYEGIADAMANQWGCVFSEYSREVGKR